MPKDIYSVKDCEGRICIDCTECTLGWNGERSCSSGWHHDKPQQGGCFCGTPLPEVKAALLTMPRLPRVAAVNGDA